MQADWIKKSFGSRLRFLRGLCGLTQARLAETAEVTEEYISKVERGLASPSFDVIGRLCAALDTEPANLFLFTSEPTPARPDGDSPDGRAAIDLTKSITHFGSWEKDLTTGHCFWSEGLCRLLGRKPKRAAHTIDDYLFHVHPDDRKYLGKIIKGTPIGLLGKGYEYRIVRQDGVIRHVLDHCEQIKATCNGSSVLRGTVVDVTEQKRLEKMLVSTHQRLEDRIAGQTRHLTETVTRMEKEINERKIVQKALLRSEQRFRNLFVHSPISLWEEDLTDLFAYFDELRLQGVTDFAAYFEAHPESLGVCASKVRVEDVNEATLRLLKATSKEQLVTNLEHILTERSNDAFREEMRVLAEGGDLYFGEISHRTLDGDEIDLLVHFKVLTPEQVIVSLMDITERTVAEQALAKSESRLNNAQKMANIGSFELEIKTGKTHWSDQQYHLFGYESGEVTPSKALVGQHIHPDDRQAFFRNTQKALEEGAYDTKYRIVHLDGTIIWVHSVAEVLYATDGSPLRFQGTTRDITEQRRLEQMREDVQRIMRHDLRLPLAAGANAAHALLQDDNLTPNQIKLLRMLKKQHRQVLDKINRLMILFRIEDNSYVPASEPTRVMEVIGAVTEDLASLTQDKNIRIRVFINGTPCEGTEDYVVQWERALSHTLIGNLLQNAVEASPKGQEVGIYIDLDDGCRLTVRNQGAVPENIRDRFFDKFVTANKETGTGLGTYAVKLIAEAMGGHVTLETDETKGTSVSVCIPGNH